MPRPVASVSLDLDNLWSYLKTHGDRGWEAYPSYFDTVVPHVLQLLREWEWHITFFVVGVDATLDRNRHALQEIVAAKHDIGNHSYHHEPWLHLHTAQRIEDELARSEEALDRAVGRRPIGFRGPGYSCSNTLLTVLVARGYRFDASTLPTWIGPLARRYYFLTTRLTKEERTSRARLFGTFRDALLPLAPYWWELPGGRLLEIPVTTMPLVRAPFHLSYLLYMSTFSWHAASAYFKLALTLCRSAKIEPSLLLHPLDFLGGDEVEELEFFPAMGMPGEQKRDYVRRFFSIIAEHFEVISINEHHQRLVERAELGCRAPNLVAGSP